MFSSWALGFDRGGYLLFYASTDHYSGLRWPRSYNSLFRLCSFSSSWSLLAFGDLWMVAKEKDRSIRQLITEELILKRG